MPRLDAFIDVLFQKGADALVLETGSVAILEGPGPALLPLIKRTLTTAHIVSAVAELMPAYAATSFTGKQDEEIGAGHCRNARRQPIIVAIPNFIRGHRVVLVDHRDSPHLQELVQRRPKFGNVIRPMFAIDERPRIAGHRGAACHERLDERDPSLLAAPARQVIGSHGPARTSAR